MTLHAVDFAAESRKLKTSLVLWLEKILMFICNSGSQGLLCGGCVLWICPLVVSSLDDLFVVSQKEQLVVLAKT